MIVKLNHWTLIKLKSLRCFKVEQIESFRRDIVVKHDMLKQCLTTVKDSLYQRRAPLLFVYGPSFVGKSKFTEVLYNEIIQENWEKLHTDREWIPIIRIEAKAPESLNFSFKDLYREMLKELNDPIIKTESNHYIQKKSFGLRETAADLRLAVENALIYRRPLGIIIDEAQHLTRVATGHKLENQMDVIKSLANITKVPFVLTGTYGLADLLDQSAQLCNRTNDFHFHRYHLEEESEKYHYISALATFATLLPVQVKPDLVTHWSYLYMHTIGCVGVLKEWLIRALYASYGDPECNGKTIELKHFEQTQLPLSRLHKMMQEVNEGEMKLTESDSLKQKLAMMLGLTEVGEKQESNVIKPKKQRKVGERKPKRDPVLTT